MSKSIFETLGADTTVELNIKTNALSLSDLLDADNRIKSEHLPEGGGHSSQTPQVDLQPLTDRVEKLETAKEDNDVKLAGIESDYESLRSSFSRLDYYVHESTWGDNSTPLTERIQALEESKQDIEARVMSSVKTVYDLKRFIGQEDNAEIQVREDVKQLLGNPQEYIKGVVPPQRDLTPLTESLNSLKSRMDYLGQIRVEMDQLHNWLGKVFFDKNKINWAANKGFEMPRADAMGLLQDGINATLEAWFTSKGLSVSGLEKLKSDVESLERSISNLWSKVTLLEERMGG